MNLKRAAVIAGIVIAIVAAIVLLRGEKTSSPSNERVSRELDSRKKVPIGGKGALEQGALFVALHEPGPAVGIRDVPQGRVASEGTRTIL